jgi:hypothetical protein
MMSDPEKTETVREKTTERTEVVATPVTTDASQAKGSVEVNKEDVTD